MCNPSISPDGARVAADITDQKANNVDLWLFNLKDGGNTRFTFTSEEEIARLVARRQIDPYRSNLGAGAGVLVKPASGLGDARILEHVEGTDDVIPNSWTLDNQTILCTHFTPSGYVLDLVPSSAVPRLVFIPAQAMRLPA